MKTAVAHVPAGLEIDQRNIAIVIANRQDFLSEREADENDGKNIESITNRNQYYTSSQRWNRTRAHLVLHLRGAHAHGNKLHHFRIANATLRLERLRVKECDAVLQTGEWARPRERERERRPLW